MNNLKRELAPISSAAWEEIDEEATRVLKLKLAGRKLVDFEGPLGPTGAAVNTGRRERLNAGPVADVEASRRQVLPLVELRAYFDLSREEMDGVERGAKDPELQPLIDAATRIAYAEDTAIFHGYAAGGIKGIDQVTAYPILPIPDDYQDSPRSIAEATRLLRHRAGPALLHRPHPGGGRRRLPGAERGAEAGGRADRVGSRHQRRGGDEPARRRLRADGGAGHVDRLPEPQRHVGAPLPGRDHDLPRAHARGGG